ncbi:MAG: hypothetical protein HY235_18605 [Acidobacteria bacterium]|nr:hypothetical protein [Acidobacteriota bacterium]
MNCTGGTLPAVGAVLPQVNISVTLSTNITNRLLNDPITDALLFIDDPAPAAQAPCAPASGNTVCTPLYYDGTGASTTSVATFSPRNIFQGVRQNDTTIVFLGVPIMPPASGNLVRVYRIKSIRAAIAGASAPNGQIFAFVSIQNPPSNLQLNNSTANVAFVQQGLVFALRSRSGGSFSGTTVPSSTGGGTFYFQCDSYNSSLASSTSANYNSTGGRGFELRYTEGYHASFKVRDVNPPLTEPGIQQNIPQQNSGADPTNTCGTTGCVVESGFYNTAFTTTNGLNRAGRSDHGTRLRAAFSNVPANVRLYVSVHALNSAAVATGSQWSNGGETSSTAAAYAVATNAQGANFSFIGTGATQILAPSSAAEIGTLGGNVARYPSGATTGLIEVPLTSGSGSFTWEVFSQDPTIVESISFAVSPAYRSSNNPGLGTAVVNGSFAPIASGTGSNTMSSSLPIPRFADQSVANNSFSINVCRTNLLFPFLSNQAGFDSGIAISNTSADPFGTSPQSGNCTLNYYGGTTGGGAAPSAQTTTSPLNGGQTMTASLSSGGTNGIAATPGFQGYVIAQCNFRYAHGFAFISDVGSQKLAEGYLALVMDSIHGVNRTGIAGEELGE